MREVIGKSFVTNGTSKNGTVFHIDGTNDSILIKWETAARGPEFLDTYKYEEVVERIENGSWWIVPTKEQMEWLNEIYNKSTFHMFHLDKVERDLIERMQMRTYHYYLDSERDFLNSIRERFGNIK